ncbi:unnamed protein product [Diatraea saccharalis]|uniref:Uncharacterized protein n=1 Tax=Diatraea saccharalis TaxID=40085 RepID=A0A9N9R2W9_9NEOP|nr:unnamed protein product [Diatraea saccharalis]
MWRGILLACSMYVAVVTGQVRPNRVVDVVTTCDKGALIATIHMEQPFKGIIFSKDFSRECRVQGIKELCAHSELLGQCIKGSINYRKMRFLWGRIGISKIDEISFS